ncbi:hypothetical protein PIB30_102067, partial [Stylosanthes scabra]|nr:hypothetical protein [Stylosanthes scabra]
GYYMIRCTCWIVGNRLFEKICRITTNNNHPNTVNLTPPINHEIHKKQRYQPLHTRQAYPTNFPVNTFPTTYEEALRTFHQENKEMREAQKKTKTQLTNVTELLNKFTNQVTVDATYPHDS